MDDVLIPLWPAGSGARSPDQHALVATTFTEQTGGRAQAIAFLIGAYAGVKTPAGKGFPHARVVADILRDAGSGRRPPLVART